MKKEWVESPNWSPRESGTVNAIVIHYTALPLSETLERFRDRKSGTSSHYLIDRNGTVIQMVRDEHKAWHAGRSRFQGSSDVNDFSIGIELVNWGLLKRKGGEFYTWKENWSHPYEGAAPYESTKGFWEPFTEEQYASLAELLEVLCRIHPSITRERIKGHSDVCVPKERKLDPGDAFDWERVLDSLSG